MKDGGLIRIQVALKRAFDITVSLVLLLLLGPLMLAITVLLKLSEPGDAVFRQERAGKDGVTFTIFKFRTMREPRDDSERGASDRRITRIGRVLRRTSLDELPQLVNVLRGDMSLVGPRPDLPHHAAAYSSLQRRRLMVRPGITGWAQVHGRNDLTWPQRIELDLDYLDDWSLRRDVVVLVKTARAVLGGRGTELAR